MVADDAVARVGRGQVAVVARGYADLYERHGLRLALTSLSGACVWRCRAPKEISAEDLAAFGELGLAELWDLRTEDERAKAPGLLMPGVRVRTMPGRLYPPNREKPRRSEAHVEGASGESGAAGVGAAARDGAIVGAGHRMPQAPGDPDIPGEPGRAGDKLAGQLAHGRAGQGVPGERMLAVYRSMAERAEMLVPAVRALATAEAPALVCCTSGKDRTGVACYCAQLAAGISEADARASYLATNVVNARVNEADLDALRRRGLPELRLEVARSLFEAREEYLDTFVSGVADIYGSLDRYLAHCME